MGHDAFVGSYRKPSFKLHFIIFVTIVGVSVFLSTQVEKSKDNTHVKALKIPVPIDSVFVDEDAAKKAANTNSSSRTAEAQPVIESDTETEYRFDGGPNIADIDKMLAKHDEPSEAVNTEKPEINAAVDTSSTGELKRENDIAIMVTDSMVDETVVGETLIDKGVVSEDSKPEPAKTKSKFNAIGKMDTVYELQQDRFLETLAKTANLEMKETVEIKRIKEAIRADRPLTISSVVKTKPGVKNKLADNKKSLVKVASTKATGVIETKSSAPGNATVTKKSTVVTKIAKTSGQKPNVVEKIDITKSELNNVLLQFTRSYNKGDINRLIALFDDNAKTNDQKNKVGIKAEYADLFKSTADRNITINNMHWNLGKGKARGDAKFIVTVKPKGSAEQARFQGSIEITAIKESRGVFIKSLIHTVSTQ